MRCLVLPAGAGWADLVDRAARLTAAPIDRSRPLWELTVIEGLPEGRAALLQRVHHCLADGLRWLRIARLLADVTPATRTTDDRTAAAAPQRTDRADDRGPLGTMATALAGRVSTVGSIIGSLAGLVRQPAELPGIASRALGVAAPQTDSSSSSPSTSVVADRIAPIRQPARRRRRARPGRAGLRQVRFRPDG